MTSIPLSEASTRLSEIADQVARTRERVHLTRNGHEDVVIVSAVDIDSLEATLELLADEAGIARQRAAEKAVAAGDVTEAKDMSSLMARRLREG